MINYIWFFLILIGILVAIFTGNIDAINDALIEDAEGAVMFAIGLIGIMAVWLGLMNIAERSGLIKFFSRAARPVTRILFPDIPKDHPAMSAIIMNMITNMFGAGNSATAIGIKAMEEMNTLNKEKNKATNAMCMFLIINMSSIQLVPLTVIKIRADAGSAAPTEIIGTTLIATVISTLTAIISAKIMQVRG